jgi:hypothetical protein
LFAQAFITSVRLLREREVPLTHRLPAICLLEMHREKGSLSLSLSLGQTEKNSVRAYVFRFAPRTRTLLDAAGMSETCQQETRAPQQFNRLLDHLVGASAQCPRRAKCEFLQSD